MDEPSANSEPKVQPQPDGPNKPPRKPGTRVGADETPGWSDVQTIREHPSSFIGSTSNAGLHHLIHDLILFLAGNIDESSSLQVVVNGNSSITINVDKTNWLTGETAFDLSETSINSSFTTLLSGDKDRPYSRIVTRGLPIPLVVVNALSEYLYLEVIHEGFQYRKRFVRGDSSGSLSSDMTQKADLFSITLLPDDEIFAIHDDEGQSAPVELSRNALSALLRETAYLHRGRTFSLKDYRPLSEVETEVFHFEGGIAQYVEFLNEGRTSLHGEPIYFSNFVKDIFVECALQWTDLYSKSVYSFVNGVGTLEGGTHLAGFFQRIKKDLNRLRQADKTHRCRRALVLL